MLWTPWSRCRPLSSWFAAGVPRSRQAPGPGQRAGAATGLALELGGTGAGVAVPAAGLALELGGTGAGVAVPAIGLALELGGTGAGVAVPAIGLALELGGTGAGVTARTLGLADATAAGCPCPA
jgi:hypothetical protein